MTNATLSAWKTALLLGMVCLSLLCGAARAAQTITVAPSFVYRTTNAFVRDLYGSPEDALAALNQWLSPNWRAYGLTPDYTYQATPYYYWVNGKTKLWGYTQEDLRYSPPDRWFTGAIEALAVCPSGFSGPDTVRHQYLPDGLNNIVVCTKQILDDPAENTCPIGNPVYPSNGVKLQSETDYQGADGLAFTRTYRSNYGFFASPTTGGLVDNSAIGGTSATCLPVVYDKPGAGPTASCNAFVPTGAQEYHWLTADGRRVVFTGSANAPTARAGLNLTLARQTNGQGAVEWHLRREDDSVEVYNAQGLLQRKTTRGGWTATHTYSDGATPASVAPRPGLLIRISSPSGRSLNLTYAANGQLATLTDPAGGVTRYTYDTQGNLTQVAYPDGTSKRYVYGNAPGEQAANTAGVWQSHALTGIVDANGVRYATFQYDASGRAVSTGHVGGAEAYRFAYNADGHGSTDVTDLLNTTRTYGYTTVPGLPRDTGVSQPGGAGCAAASSAVGYDTNGNVVSSKDFNGNRKLPRLRQPQP